MQAEKKQGRQRRKESALPFTRANVILFFTGLVLIVVGYIALGVKPWNSFVSLNVAPVLLVLGYCVVIPVAILYHKKENGPAADKKVSEAGKPAQPGD
jgi:fumarate reductase subunit C